MKLLLILGLAACVWSGILLAQSAWAGLGVGDATGKAIVDGWLESGYLNATPAARAFKAASPASRAALVKTAVAGAKSYTESPAFKVDYEKRWPVDRKALVARRLQEFLDIGADIDFDAKLLQAGKLMRFADPRYEEKPPTWKRCFRSGREAVAAAREAAQGWLKAAADLRG